jgi:hypothetical protein
MTKRRKHPEQGFGSGDGLTNFVIYFIMFSVAATVVVIIAGLFGIRL